MNVRCRVELSQAERAELTALLSRGKHAARKLKRAQILVAADAGASDDEIGRERSQAVPKLMRLAMTACRSAVSASLFVGGRLGLVTKAVMASQSLRISRASARALAAAASSFRRQARFRRARIGVRLPAFAFSATAWISPRSSRTSQAPKRAAS